MAKNITRRGFITGLAALTLYSALPGCGTEDEYPYDPDAQIYTMGMEDDVVLTPFMKKTAVLVIDMQPAYSVYINDDELEEEIPNQMNVLEYARTRGLATVLIEYEGAGETIDPLRKEVASLDDKWYVTKTHDDAFEDTDLADILRSDGIENLLLMGINASACVAWTAIGATNNGFNVMTSRQIIANHDDWDRYDENVDFYQEIGFYRDNYTELLRAIDYDEVEFPVK